MDRGSVGGAARGRGHFRDTSGEIVSACRLSSHLFHNCSPFRLCEPALTPATLLKQAWDFALKSDLSLTAGAGTRQGRDVRLALQPLHGLIPPCPPKIRASYRMLRNMRQRHIVHFGSSGPSRLRSYKISKKHTEGPGRRKFITGTRARRLCWGGHSHRS